MPKRTIPVIAFLTIGILLCLQADLAAARNSAPDNEYWWPNRLDLEPLRRDVRRSSPLGEDFNYAEAFESLDLDCQSAFSIDPRSACKTDPPERHGGGCPGSQ